VAVKVEKEQSNDSVTGIVQFSKKSEQRVFFFVTIFLAPILTVLLISGYGFIVWMLQNIFGPPGV
jgi:nitrate reductase NapE